jgi:fibronectin type III domain protein
VGRSELDFSGAVRSTAALSATPVVSPTFSATDANGDSVYNVLNAVNIASSKCTVQNTTYCMYRAYLTVPPPGAPTGVTAVQVGDEFQVSWTPAVNPAVITSSTITATPVGSTAQVVSATETGSATTGFVGSLQPMTTYQIIVVSTDAGGSSPPSSPITLTTQPATVVPSAPTNVTAHWTAPGAANDQLVASWTAAVPGDSPTDQYQITISGSDGAGTFTQTVAGSVLTASFSDDIPDWSIKVRAHNAAAWGPWSATFVLGGTYGRIYSA